MNMNISERGFRGSVRRSLIHGADFEVSTKAPTRENTKRQEMGSQEQVCVCVPFVGVKHGVEQFEMSIPDQMGQHSLHTI